MYTKEEREGILWEFHQSGMSVAEACRRLALFPNEWNLRRWLRMEEAVCLIASNLRIGTAVGILDQIGTGRKPHVQRRAEKDRDRDLRQVRP